MYSTDVCFTPQLFHCSRFLFEVQQNSDVNKMISSNLGTVFGPNLLRPEVLLLYCMQHVNIACIKITPSILFIAHLVMQTLSNLCVRISV